MPPKGSSEGSIYFNSQRKNWSSQYYEYDPETGKNKRKTKSFKTEEEAKKYLNTVMYQKENALFIEHNGIPLCEFMKSNLKIKLDTEQIESTQYARVMRTIEQIEKMPIGHKNIDEITSEELQKNVNYYKHFRPSTNPRFISRVFAMLLKKLKNYN